MEVYKIIGLLLVVIAILISSILSIVYYVRHAKYKKVNTSLGKTGGEIATILLKKYNLKDIKLEKISGKERYFFTPDTIYLSEDIYSGKTLYDTAVSAYTTYSFIKKIESKYLIKFLENLSSFLKYTILFGYSIIVLGLSFEISNLVWIGIYLLVFSFITNLWLFLEENKLTRPIVMELRDDEIIDIKEKESLTKMLSSIINLSVASLVFNLTSSFQKIINILINDEE